MSAIQIDIIDGASLRETADGYEATRTAVVTGLTGDASSRQYRALTLPNMPRRGDAHPSIPGISLDRAEASSLDGHTGSVRVTLTYRNVDAADIPDSGTPRIEVGTALVSETTSRDVKGRMMTIVTLVPELDDDGNQIGTQTDEQVVTVTKQVPLSTLRFNRKESRDPWLKSAQFTGTVGSWGAVGQSEPLWMCAGISGTTDDSGASWDVSYEFIYNPRTWLARVEAIDPATGQPYLSGDTRTFRIYPEATYVLLDLPPPDGLTPGLFF